jgi:hypothetical protein
MVKPRALKIQPATLHLARIALHAWRPSRAPDATCERASQQVDFIMIRCTALRECVCMLSPLHSVQLTPSCTWVGQLTRFTPRTAMPARWSLQPLPMTSSCGVQLAASFFLSCGQSCVHPPSPTAFQPIYVSHGLAHVVVATHALTHSLTHSRTHSLTHSLACTRSSPACICASLSLTPAYRCHSRSSLLTHRSPHTFITTRSRTFIAALHHLSVPTHDHHRLPASTHPSASFVAFDFEMTGIGPWRQDQGDTPQVCARAPCPFRVGSPLLQILVCHVVVLSVTHSDVKAEFRS